VPQVDVHPPAHRGGWAVLTAASYANTDAGDTYYVFKGALVLAPIFAVANGIRWARSSRQLSILDAHVFAVATLRNSEAGATTMG